MIYLDCNIKNENNLWIINYIHYLPFDPINGLNKSQEELSQTGYVVDIIVPIPSPPQNQSINRMYYNDVTNEITYEYSSEQGDPVETNREFIKLKERLDKLEKKINSNPDTDFKSIVADNVSLSQLQEAKIAQLNYLCNQSILASFKSNCLGIEHTYPFDYESQLNLSGTMNAYNSGIITGSIDWKTEDAGVLTHTKSQFYKLYSHGMSHKKDLIATYWSLKTQVSNAKTKTEVLAIEW